MTRSYWYFLRIFINVLNCIGFIFKWIVLRVINWYIFLYWFWTMIFLSRSYRLSFSILCRFFSFNFFQLSFNINNVRFILWCRIYVQRSIYKPFIIFIKSICYKCCFSVLLLRLFFNFIFLGVYWVIFVFIS